MQELQRQHLVDLRGVVPVSFEMSSHHRFKPVRFEVRPGERPRVEQHLLNILGEGIPVPDAEMVELVPAKEEPFEAEEREEMIDPGYPLGHTVIIGVFRFDCELEEMSR